MGFLTGCANPQSGDAVSPHGLYRNWQPVPNDAPTSNRADVSRAGAWARNLDRFSACEWFEPGRVAQTTAGRSAEHEARRQRTISGCAS